MPETSVLQPVFFFVDTCMLFLVVFLTHMWFQVGYMLHDRVLRPAEVGVTEGGPSEEDEPEQKSSGD
jgi:hypothetical protein